jgi:L-alanine-DL-glutamate epimerase-like enolase superfamily enzyme
MEIGQTVIKKVTATAHSILFGNIAMQFGVGKNVKRDMVLVRVETEDGIVGYGESHHALSPTTIAELINSSMAQHLIGECPLNTEGIWNKIYLHQVATHGAGTAAVIAMSGLDMALWDLKGKILQQPVYSLLGGLHKRIRAYAGGLSLGYQPLSSLEKEVRKYVDLGYTAIKLRVGTHAKDDAERVGCIRKIFGPDLDIAVDAATRYKSKDIPLVIKYCEDNNVYWLEEPFTPDDIEAYTELRKNCGTPIAAGENHYTKYQFRGLLRADALSILQPDCTKTGGITEAKKIADMAEAWHLPVAPHTGQSILSASANVHVMCAIPNALIFEADLAELNPFRDDISSSALLIKDGYIEPNNGPGLGLNINESILEKYPAIPGPCYV